MAATSRQETSPLASIWRRALGPALFSVAGNMVGFAAALVTIMVYFPPAPGAIPAVVAMFLCGWLLFRTQLAAWAQRTAYWRPLSRSFLAELGSTLFVLMGAMPAALYLMNYLFREAVDSPLFLLIVLLISIAQLICDLTTDFILLRNCRQITSGKPDIDKCEGSRKRCRDLSTPSQPLNLEKGFYYFIFRVEPCSGSGDSHVHDVRTEYEGSPTPHHITPNAMTLRRWLSTSMSGSTTGKTKGPFSVRMGLSTKITTNGGRSPWNIRQPCWQRMALHDCI